MRSAREASVKCFSRETGTSRGAWRSNVSGPISGTPRASSRFADEVRAVGQLEHPNIVPVHDVGIDETGQHYLVMKYVQGETLESIIEHLAAGDPSYVARFPQEHRARIFLSILQALRYAHGRGIIHRDIKPANIMVGPHGEVTVMDWGLAKTVGRDVGLASAAANASPASKTWKRCSAPSCRRTTPGPSS
jgi:serine/threonine protein kinase